MTVQRARRYAHTLARTITALTSVAVLAFSAVGMTQQPDTPTQQEGQ